MAMRYGTAAAMLLARLAGRPVAARQGFPMPPVAPDAPGYASLGALGGSAAGNDAARADAWPKALAFLSGRLAR